MERGRCHSSVGVSDGLCGRRGAAFVVARRPAPLLRHAPGGAVKTRDAAALRQMRVAFYELGRRHSCGFSADR